MQSPHSGNSQSGSSHSSGGFSSLRCVRHNYLYYPFDWTDEVTGKKYRQGYYDEDGNYYKDVVFRRNGKYEDILCQCEYCDTVTKLDWTEDGPLICPQCGGSMKILSALDEYAREPNWDSVRQSGDSVDPTDRNRDGGKTDDVQEEDSDKNTAKTIITAFIILIMLLGLIVEAASSSNSYPTSSSRLMEIGYVYWDSVNNKWVHVDQYGNVISDGSGGSGGSNMIPEDDETPEDLVHETDE